MAKDFQDEIEAACHLSGNTLGWRFLYSPCDTLNGARVAFIGLNPGGTVIDEDHSTYAMDQGSAYRDESWGGHAPGESPLQKQVLALFRMLDVAPEKVLAGNLVPFRSRDWASLTSPENSLKFGKKLWTDVLRRARPPLVITMGASATSAIADVVGAGNMTKHPTGWGKVTMSTGDYPGGLLVGLPHLSRFGIVTRQVGARVLSDVFNGSK